MSQQDGEATRQGRSRWLNPLALGSIALSLIAAIVYYDAAFNDVDRIDLANLALAIQRSMKMGIAMVLWGCAALLAIGLLVYSVATKRLRPLSAVAFAACLIPLAAYLLHASQPTSEKLVVACRQNDTRAVSRLLNRGADIDQAAWERLGFDHGRRRGNTPLTAAVEWGSYEVVVLLVQRGADVNQVDGYRKSPLGRALESRRPDFAEFLLLHGSKPEQQGLGQNRK